MKWDIEKQAIEFEDNKPVRIVETGQRDGKDYIDVYRAIKGGAWHGYAKGSGHYYMVKIYLRGGVAEFRLGFRNTHELYGATMSIQDDKFRYIPNSWAKEIGAFIKGVVMVGETKKKFILMHSSAITNLDPWGARNGNYGKKMKFPAFTVFVGSEWESRKEKVKQESEDGSVTEV